MPVISTPIDGLSWNRYFTILIMHSSRRVNSDFATKAGLKMLSGTREGMVGTVDTAGSGGFRLVRAQLRKYIRSQRLLDMAADSRGYGAVDICEYSAEVPSGGFVRWIATPFAKMTMEIAENLVSSGILRTCSFCRVETSDVLRLGRTESELLQGVEVRRIQGNLPGDDRVGAVTISGTDTLASDLYRMLEDRFGEIPIKPTGLVMRFTGNDGRVAFSCSTKGHNALWMQQRGRCISAFGELVSLLFSRGLVRITKDLPTMNAGGEEM